MVMQAMRGEGKTGGILKYFLFTLLGMAVGGLVLGSFSEGGSVSSNDVARIDNQTISIQSFDRAFQRYTSQFNISTKQAYKLGMAEDVLSTEIRNNFLLLEAQNMGIEISKDQLAKRIAQVVKPHAKEGESLQTALENILKWQGMKEKDFVAEIKKEMSGEIVMNAFKSGLYPTNDLLVNDLYLFQTQTRDIELILFPDNKNAKDMTATQEQLMALYEAVKRQKYQIPEYRSVNTATFDESKMDIEFSVSDEEIKSIYEENQDNFHIGEQLVLSQIVTKDKKQADDIYALVEQGKPLKSAVISVMSDKATYIENVKFETSMMLPDLMKSLESREIGKVVAPVKTMLGYHVVKLEDILKPSIRPFNEVKSGIKKELIETKKYDYFYSLSTEFDAMINDEMSLSDIAKELNIEISSIGFIDKEGKNKDGQDILQMFGMKYKPEAAQIIFEIDKSMPSSMQDFGGKLIAFEIKAIKPPTFKPFDSVKDELSKQFKSDMLRSDNEVLMQKYLAELSTGGSNLKTIAKDNNLEIEKISNISIGGATPAPLSNNVMPVIFKTPLGGYETIRLDNQSALIKISGYGFSKQDNAEIKNKNLSDIKSKLDEEVKEEIFMMYLHSLSKKYPATINNRLLERAYGGAN